MKAVYLIIISLYSTIVLPQNAHANLEVEYQVVHNIDLPFKMFCTLYIRDNASIYSEKYTTKENLKDNIDNGGASPARGGIPDLYFKTDYNKKELLYFDESIQYLSLIKDIYTELAWNISSETKEIAGYTCNKATVSYRGRNWVTWFAPEIPAAFGPWKLHGLPGLILEAHDTGNIYTMLAVKIQNNKESNLFDKEFSTLVKARNKQPISLKQYLEEYEESLNNIHHELAAQSSGSLTFTRAPRSGMELMYEWEK